MKGCRRLKSAKHHAPRNRKHLCQGAVNTRQLKKNNIFLTRTIKYVDSLMKLHLACWCSCSLVFLQKALLESPERKESTWQTSSLSWSINSWDILWIVNWKFRIIVSEQLLIEIINTCQSGEIWDHVQSRLFWLFQTDFTAGGNRLCSLNQALRGEMLQ